MSKSYVTSNSYEGRDRFASLLKKKKRERENQLYTTAVSRDKKKIQNHEDK